MSLAFWIVLALGLVTLISSVILISGLVASSLHAVPPLKTVDPEEMMFFPAESRIGLKLHEACFQNDPQAAKEALVKWMWVTGEASLVNPVDGPPTTFDHPEMVDAVIELWAHLEEPQGRRWFGDNLWRGFTATNPKFREMEKAHSG